LPIIIVSDLKQLSSDLKLGFDFNTYEPAALWLAENTPPGSIVFHSDWDEFPMLFYYNNSNFYLVGLDPTFMYNYNKDLYWKWHNITLGSEVQNIYQIIKNDFNAEYVFVEASTHELLDRNLRNNFYFELVYQDEISKIYKVN
jgi:hypothetical protein